MEHEPQMTLCVEPTLLMPNGSIEKATTGIAGLDELTKGGLPKGRTALVCGGAGCGKTLLSMTFLVRGATEFGEPGLFVSFEESGQDLAKNVASLGFDLADLIARRQLHIDHVRVERSEIEETGEYDLEGLFVRLGYAIDRIGAKRVVLDTLEALFGGLSNTAILRSELRRLFGWLKEKGVTSIVTAERGENALRACLTMQYCGRLGHRHAGCGGNERVRRRLQHSSRAVRGCGSGAGSGWCRSRCASGAAAGRSL
jgi:KaiC/GvpD/RAD55 family RecA-like ATPase